MRLGVVPSFALSIVLAHEIVHSDDFHLRRGGVACVGRARTILADAASFKAAVKQFLLTLQLIVCLGDFQLLLLHQLLETVFEFLFECSFLFVTLGFPLLFVLLKVVDLLLEDLDVQLELLLNFDVVPHLRLVLLQLRLVLFGRQVDRVERRSELARRIVEATCRAIVMPVVASARVRLLVFFKPTLHDVLELSLDVAQNGQTGQVAQPASLISQLLRLNHVDLSGNQHKRTSIIEWKAA